MSGIKLGYRMHGGIGEYRSSTRCPHRCRFRNWRDTVGRRGAHSRNAVSAGELAERARDRALDPTITPAALEARRESEDAAFSRDRMSAAVVRLRHRLDEVRDQEEQARRQAAYDAAKAERDELAEELARSIQTWPHNLPSLPNGSPPITTI